MSGSGAADVLVVGAGPAGSVTALMLARAGLRVRVLERGHHPRDKPCGDCLSAAAGATLERLGLRRGVEALAPARLRGWRVVSPGGEAMEAPFVPEGSDAPRTAMAVRRARLDALLAAEAARAGAELLEGVTVREAVEEGGRVVGAVATGPGGAVVEHRARWTVDASGLRSPLARRLGAIRRRPRLRKLSLTAHVRGMPPSDGLGHLHLAPGLCCGLAPVEDGTGRAAEDVLWNVSLVADQRRWAREVAGDAMAFVRASLPRFPRANVDPGALRFERHSDGGTLLASGPFDVPTRRAAFPGAVLVGDAAGYYDPFTGQGVHHALLGAEALAATLEAAVREGRTDAVAVAPYLRFRARTVAPARRVQRGIELVLARPRLADGALRRLGRAAAPAAALVAVTGDLAAPATLLRPGLLLSFLLGR